MLHLLQTRGRCSDLQFFLEARLLDFDPHGVGRELAFDLATSWSDLQLVVATPDVSQPVLARYRQSGRLSVEHGHYGQVSGTPNGTFPCHCGQNEMLNKQERNGVSVGCLCALLVCVCVESDHILYHKVLNIVHSNCQK